MVSKNASKNCMNVRKSTLLPKGTILKEILCKYEQGYLFLYNKPIQCLLFNN
jgi:hypothetical protein